MLYFVFFFFYLYVSGSGSITSVGEKSCLLFTCSCVVSVRRGFSSSVYLGWAAIFYCGTP